MFCAFAADSSDQTKLVYFAACKESSHFATCRKQGLMKPSVIPSRRLRRGLMDVSQLER